MSHNARVRGPADAWANVLPVELEILDENLASAINGDDGGCWAPSNPIVIGVSGLVVTGPTVLARGGTLTTTDDPSAFTSPTITCGDGDWPELDRANPLNVRPILIPCATACGVPQSLWTVRRETGALQAFAPMYDLSDGLGPRPSRAYLRIRAHDQATLTNLTVVFRVGATHTSLPTVMPSVRALRVDAMGNAVPMTSQAAGADINGYVFVATPTGAAAWTNNLASQSLSVPIDQNNAVDTSQYDYVLELVEEQGLTGYPWSLVYTPGLLVATTAPVTLAGLQTVDGVVTGTGDGVLVKNQGDPTQNGIYLAAAGAWARAPFLSQASQITQGMVVPIVGYGQTNSFSFWQLQSTITTWTPPQGSTPGTPLVFLPKTDVANPAEGTGYFGHGLLWQSVLATFSEIGDIRPQ